MPGSRVGCRFRVSDWGLRRLRGSKKKVELPSGFVTCYWKWWFSSLIYPLIAWWFSIVFVGLPEGNNQEKPLSTLPLYSHSIPMIYPWPILDTLQNMWIYPMKIWIWSFWRWDFGENNMKRVKHQWLGLNRLCNWGLYKHKTWGKWYSLW